MFAEAELKQLEETKKLLVVQADIHRSILNMELATWSAQVERLQAARQTFTAYRGLILAAAAAAGLFAAKRGGSLLRMIPIALSVWRAARGFFR